MDLAKLKKDMSSASLKNHLRSDMVEAQQHGITGTPSIYIHGRKLKKRSFADFQKLIDEELSKIGT